MAKRFLSNIRINDAYTFPASDGTNNQVIKTDGSGNLSFGQLAADSASVMYKDTFTGDGSTTGFTLANALNDEVQSNIYIDGVYQSKSTYSVSGTTVTFSTAPLSGHEIEVISTTGINSGPTAIYTDTFTANGSTTAFTLGQTVHSENQTIVFLNGVYQFKGTYILSGTTLTLDTAPANGVSIEVMSIGSAYSGGDILYDHDFTSAGLMTSDGSGVYSITANNSANWNTAYGWGDHGLSAQDKTDIENLSGTNTGDQDLSSYATQSYVGTQISNLVDSSPATLNTLNELAAALGDDPNFATTTANSIGLKAPLASPSFTGIITANSSSSGDYVRLYGSSGTGKWDIYGNGANLRISDNESAGILAVDTGATFGGNVNIIASNSSTGSSVSPKMLIYNEGAGDSALQLAVSGSLSYYLGVDNSDNTFKIGNASWDSSPFMAIDSSGNVGIGVTSPDTQLDVSGTIKNYATQSASTWLQGNGGGLNYGMDIFLTNDLGSTQGATRLRSAYGGIGTAGMPNFSISRSTTNQAYNSNPNTLTYSESLVIDGSSGNVGIGTTSPDVKLHVYNGDSGATTVGGASDELILENDTDCGLTIRSGTSSDGAISFADSGDHNIGQVYYSHGSNSMTFRTNDNTAVTIDSSQNVGIGTTTPTYKLHLNNSATLTPTYQKFTNGTATTGTTLGIDADGDFLINNGENKEIKLYTSDSQRLTIQSGGNVGIGTNSPGYKLQVQGTGYYSGQLTVDGFTNNAGISFRTGITIANVGIRAKAVGTTNRDGLELLGYNGIDFTVNNGANVAMRIVGVTGSGMGNVGIGQTAPGQKLVIGNYDSVANGTMRITALGGQSIGVIRNSLEFALGGPTYVNGLDAWKFSIGLNSAVGTSGNYNSDFVIRRTTRVGVTDNVDFMIDGTSGNVGIGTTGPLSKLHVNGGNINIQNVDSSSPYTASGKLRFLGRYDRYLGGINTVNTGSYAEYDNGLDFYVQRDTFNAAGHFAMRINHLGNVGIGTASPFANATTNQGLNIDKGGHSSLLIGDGINDGGMIQASDDSQRIFIGANLYDSPTGSWNSWVTTTGRSGIDIANWGVRVNTSASGNGFGIVRFFISPLGTVNIRNTSNDAPSASSLVGSGFKYDSKDRATLCQASNSTTLTDLQEYFNPNGAVGKIQTNGSSTLFTTSSDYRLKEDLKSFNGLDMISNIAVYDFKWKISSERGYGVMAHELQEILPQAVGGDKDYEKYALLKHAEYDQERNLTKEAEYGTRPSYQTVDYSKIVPLLVKSIQELKADNDSLKARIETLENN